MIVLYIVLAVLILLLMILIHELGHYTAGTLLKFKIKEFAVGFGPKLISKKNKKGETISLRAIPLGGFCAFAGEDIDDPDPAAFNNQKAWKRIIVLLSGAVFNIVSAVIFCIPFLAVSGFYLPEVTIVHDTPNAALIQKGDTILKINDKDLTLFKNDIRSFLNKVETGENITLTVQRGDDIITLNGIEKSEYTVLNIKGEIVYKTDAKGNILTDDKGNPIPSTGIGIGVSPVQGRYYEYDTDGETIYYYENKATICLGKYYLYTDSGTQISCSAPETKQENDWIELKSAGKWADSSGANGSYTKIGTTFTIYNDDLSVKMSGKNSNGKMTFPVDGSDMVYDCGVRGEPVIKSTINIKLSAGQVIGYSFIYPGKIAVDTLGAIGGLFTGLFKVNEVMTGPITLIGTIASLTMNDAAFILMLLPFIAVGLGISNLLPVPALDGCRIIFCLIELIARKPVPRKIEGIIHVVGFFLLIALAISIDFMNGVTLLQGCAG